jgi:hypothetical protein
MSNIDENTKQNIEQARKQMRAYQKYVKIQNGEYRDLVFLTDLPNSIITHEGMFRGEPTGSMQTTFKCREVGVDIADNVQELSMSPKSGDKIAELLYNGHNPLRVYRTGESTNTKYTAEPI